MKKYIHFRFLNPTSLPGGVLAIGRSVVINGYKNNQLLTKYYCIVEADSPDEASYEIAKEYLKATTIYAYVRKRGLLPLATPHFYSNLTLLLDSGITKDPPPMDEYDQLLLDLDYVVSTVSYSLKKSPKGNLFHSRSKNIYTKLANINKFGYQAGAYLTLAYALYGVPKESILNFTKVMECIILNLKHGRGDCKLTDKHLIMLEQSLELTPVDVVNLKKLSRVRDDLAAHGVMDPELEYQIGEYMPGKGLAEKYFNVGDDKFVSIKTIRLEIEPVVRKCFAKFLDIPNYSERQLSS